MHACVHMHTPVHLLGCAATHCTRPQPIGLPCPLGLSPPTAPHLSTCVFSCAATFCTCSSLAVVSFI